MSVCPPNNASIGDGALREEQIQRALAMLNIETNESHTMEEKCNLLQGSVTNVDNVIIIFDIMDCLNVSSEGATTVEEMKERIKIRLIPTEADSNQEINTLIAVKTEFENKKKDLSEMYKNFIDILNTKFPAMQDRLSSEDIISNTTSSIQETLEALNSSQCTVIVAGETGSGKSTLLNLILKDMVLPHHAISCTSTICMIKYGKQKHMKIIYCSGQVSEFDFNDDEESKAKINEAMFKRSDREQGSNIRSVELQIPSDILECGLVLVDTPGIGENEAMEEILTNFIKENQIQGFIYVIKADGASGGIQEDRILKLMNIVLQKQISSNANPTDTCLYDTATTLFISNRWDLVSEEDKKSVKEYVETRLKRCSPNIDKSEILFMSATSVIRQLENGFITTSYTELMKGIRQMMEKSAFILLKRFYRWLNYMISRSLHHCKTLFSGADFSEYQQKQKFQETVKKMNDLENNSKRIFQELRDDIDKGEIQMNENLAEYLHSEKVQAEINDFNDSEIEFIKIMQNTNEGICGIIERKIIDTISESTSLDQEINKLKEHLLKTIKKRTFILQEELSFIETEMNSEISIQISNKQRGSNFSVCSWQLPIAPPKIPSSVLGKLAFTAKEMFKKRPHRQSSLLKHIKKICSEELERFLNAKHYITSQLEPIRNYLKIAEMSIPKLIESNKRLITELAENHLKYKEEKESYITSLNELLKLQDEIAHYGYRNYFNQKKAIEVLNNISTSFSMSYKNSASDSGIVVDRNRRVPQSLFVEMIPAYSCDTEITIRKYFKHLEIPSFYNEIDKLKHLHHESIAKFIITVLTEESRPNILFDEHLFSLRRRTNNVNNRNMVHEDTYPVFIKNIASGLVYIHSNGLTHPEVSLDSVMINWHQQVKLIGMALPRKIKVVDMDQPIQDMVYLPPEVLRGETYEAPADVFGFGLLICELYIKKKVFERKSTLSISQFLETVDTSVVEYLNLVPDIYRHLVLQMINTSANERIGSSQIWRTLES